MTNTITLQTSELDKIIEALTNARYGAASFSITVTESPKIPEVVIRDIHGHLVTSWRRHNDDRENN